MAAEAAAALWQEGNDIILPKKSEMELPVLPAFPGAALPGGGGGRYWLWWWCCCCCWCWC